MSNDASIGMNPWTGGPLGDRDMKYVGRIRALEAEVARLREALGKIAALFPANMGDDGSGRVGWTMETRETVRNARRVLEDSHE